MAFRMHRRAAVAVALVSLVLAYGTANQTLAQTANAVDSFELPPIDGKQRPTKPYKLSSTVHLERGSQRGYLVVKVNLPKGKFIYSLTQPGSVPPTKIEVGANPHLNIKGKFNPDSAPKITPKDKWLGHAVEKHANTIQFFAPIEVRPGVDPAKIKVTVQLKGQICGDESCVPFQEIVVGQFAGYFEPGKVAKRAGQSAGGTVAKPVRTAKAPRSRNQ